MLQQLKILIVRLSPEKYVNLSFTHKLLAEIARNSVPGRILTDYFFFPDYNELSKFTSKKKMPLSADYQMRPCDFDIVAISNSFTLEFFNIPHFLRMSSIPLNLKDRISNPEIPLVICGGVNTPAAAPLTGGCISKGNSYTENAVLDDGRMALVDAVFLGEAEANFGQFLKKILEISDWRNSKERLLLNFSNSIAGIYLPNKFIHKYTPAGSKKHTGALRLEKIFNAYNEEKLRTSLECGSELTDASNFDEEAFTAVKNAVIDNIDELAPFCESVAEESGAIGSVPVEITRGCPSMCAFCKEGYTQKPYREKSLAVILKNAETARDCSGVGIVNLYSYNFNDHSRIHEIVKKLTCSGMVPRVKSQRIDRAAMMPELLSFLSRAGSGSPTFAVEGISERMRSYLSKNIEKKVLYDFVTSALKSRPRQIKLFFIITGLEIDADFNELNDFISFMTAKRRANMLSTNFVISLMPLVNSAKTPLQFAPMPDSDKIFRNAKKISGMFAGVERLTVRLSIERAAYELTQILECGGRELTSALCEIALNYNFAYYENVPDDILKKFKQALLNDGIDISENFSEKDFSDVLPSDDRNYGVSREFLYKSWLSSKQFKDVPRCPRNGEFACQNCGACGFKNKIYKNTDLKKADKEFAEFALDVDFNKSIKAVCDIYSSPGDSNAAKSIYELGGGRAFNIIEDAQTKLFSGRTKFLGKNFYYVSYYDLANASKKINKNCKDKELANSIGKIFYCADNSLKNLDFLTNCNYLFSKIAFTKNIKINVNAGLKEIEKQLEQIIAGLNFKAKIGRLALPFFKNNNIICYANLDGLKKHVNMPILLFESTSRTLYSVLKICPETLDMIETAEIIEYIKAFEYNVKNPRSVCPECGRVYYTPLPELPAVENGGCFICKGVSDYFRKNAAERK